MSEVHLKRIFRVILLRVPGLAGTSSGIGDVISRVVNKTKQNKTLEGTIKKSDFYQWWCCGRGGAKSVKGQRSSWNSIIQSQTEANLFVCFLSYAQLRRL